MPFALEDAMRNAFSRLAVAALLVASLGSFVSAAERRPHVEQDECARRGARCEEQCDSTPGAERLSCKTDCRLAESECRNKKR